MKVCSKWLKRKENFLLRVITGLSVSAIAIVTGLIILLVIRGV